MTRSVVRYCAALGVVAALVAIGTPANATYTKLYRFTNNTASDKGGVRAVNNSLELILGHYVNRADWDDDPYPTIGNIL